MLIVTLALTPLQRILIWPKLSLIRRMLGVTTFAYALTHLTLYTVNEKFDLVFVASEIVKRIYLTIQLMYTSREPRAYHEHYFSLVRDITSAAPSVWPYIETINNRILTGDVYKALKESGRLITYEQELLGHAARRAGLRKRSKTDIDPT